MEEDLRKEAIRRHLLDGESPKAIYTSINRSKEWFFKWLKRFQTGAEDWFKDHSKAPKSKPIAISPQEKEIIIATRTRLESDPRSQFGVSAIKWELHKLGLPLRSDSTINRTLKREGLVKKNQFILPRELNTRTLPRLFAATTYTRWTWSAPATSRVMAGFIL